MTGNAIFARFADDNYVTGPLTATVGVFRTSTVCLTASRRNAVNTVNPLDQPPACICFRPFRGREERTCAECYFIRRRFSVFYCLRTEFDGKSSVDHPDSRNSSFDRLGVDPRLFVRKGNGQRQTNGRQTEASFSVVYCLFEKSQKVFNNRCKAIYDSFLWVFPFFSCIKHLI